MTITLQKADVNLVGSIQQLARKIWPATFKEILTEEQIDYMLEMMYNEEVLKNQISNGHIFFIAREGDKELGFIGMQVDYPEDKVLKVHKIYVLPETQGQGIGKLLMNQAKHFAFENSCHCINLNVNRYNKAVDFYLKYGFEITKEEDINIGNGYFMNDFVMELKL